MKEDEKTNDEKTKEDVDREEDDEYQRYQLRLEGEMGERDDREQDLILWGILEDEATQDEQAMQDEKNADEDETY